MTDLTNRLPADVARCAGDRSDGQWREGCEECLRRTSPPADPERFWTMTPPVLVVFECAARIAPPRINAELSGPQRPARKDEK